MHACVYKHVSSLHLKIQVLLGCITVVCVSGLGYESDSEHSGSDTNSDSDAELQESIRSKKEAFERQHSKIFSDDEEYNAEGKHSIQ